MTQKGWYAIKQANQPTLHFMGVFPPLLFCVLQQYMKGYQPCDHHFI